MNTQFKGIVDAVKTMNINDIDIVIMAVGTNDYDILFDHETAIPRTMTNITELFGNTKSELKLFFFTPYIKYMGNLNETWDDSLWCENFVKIHTGYHNLSFNFLIETIITECQKNHIMVCDMYHELGLTKYWLQHNHVGGDGVHLYKAFPLIAEKMYKFVSSNAVNV